MASADRRSGDSLHLLIMDAHRALNKLQLEVATENLDGASVYKLDEEDGSLVYLLHGRCSYDRAAQVRSPWLGDHGGRERGFGSSSRTISA